jgi:hypothetical protein
MARKNRRDDSHRRIRQRKALREYRAAGADNLTPADMRFFELRASGYTGPIDQDGNAVTDGRAVEILGALRG